MNVFIEANRPGRSLASLIASGEPAISLRPVSAVVVAPRNAANRQWHGEIRLALCNGELGLFARVAPGPWVTANLNGVAGSGSERPFQGPSLVPLMPFCGWIEETHVRRPQPRHRLGL